MLRLSRGRFGLAGTWAPILLLNTTGRHTGQRRGAPLLYLKDADTYVVVGSRGGRAQHPAWYLNLVANPRVEVMVGGQTLPCLAREAEDEERSRLWQQLVTLNPGYVTYQARLRRRIPVIILQPAGTSQNSGG